MKNAIIIHGKPSKEKYYSPEYPSSSNFGWIPWLQKQLIINDIKTDTPEMPHAYLPDYHTWKREFERFDIGSETVLIGHSAGGAFILRWASENKNRNIKRLIFVAPAVHSEDREFAKFLDYKIDPKLSERVENIIIFTSDNDSEVTAKNIDTLKQKLEGVEVRLFSGYGHFIPDHMGKNDFPELLEEVLK